MADEKDLEKDAENTTDGEDNTGSKDVQDGTEETGGVPEGDGTLEEGQTEEAQEEDAAPDDSKTASPGKKEKRFGKKKDKATQKLEEKIAGLEVYKQLVTALEELGVKPIEAVGKEFDPAIHNAVMAVDDDTLESGTIAEEMQKGYMYKESVVRHSMVKVVN